MASIAGITPNFINKNKPKRQVLNLKISIMQNKVFKTFLVLVIPFAFLLINACEAPPKIIKTAPIIEHYTSENTTKMNLPFSDAVIVDNMIYLSGQLGNIPGSFKLVEGGIRAEAKQTMQNIKTVLAANGATMEDIIKCQVFIEDIKEWGVFNEEYVKFFPNKKPARSALGANGLALGARVEVECMACKKR